MALRAVLKILSSFSLPLTVIACTRRVSHRAKMWQLFEMSERDAARSYFHAKIPRAKIIYFGKADISIRFPLVKFTL